MTDAPALLPAAPVLAPDAPDDVATALGGEPLDALLWRARGAVPGLVEATLSLNPGLAAEAASLPEGRAVRLPPRAALPDRAGLRTDVVQLWS